MILKQNHVRQNLFKSEKPIPKYYFTTKEVSEIIGVRMCTIRFWTKTFNIYKKLTVYKEQWMFPRKSVAKFYHVKRLLREEHFTIEGAKLKLKIIE